MPELKFETGLVTYNLNGACEVQFNPTDSEFAERLYAAFDLLDQKQDKWREQVERMGDKREIFDFTRERDEEMREIIDNIFDAPVSRAVFGSMNVYSLAGGLPVWVNLLLAIMDEIDTAFAREQKQTNPRIKKYTAKYHK